MSDSVDMKKDPAGSGGMKDSGADVKSLMNSLKFEREKNEVLLGEVVALEDELVNRQLKDFGEVISEQSRDFWREQLLSNRDSAAAALEELKQAKEAAGSSQDTRRPLHNRERSRPLQRRGLVGEDGTATPGAENQAVRIRNRAQELCALERIPFSTAFRRAEKEMCEEVR